MGALQQAVQWLWLDQCGSDPLGSDLSLRAVWAGADRDLNAAINLMQLAGSSSDSLNACGAISAGARSRPRVKLTAVKQEPNANHGLSILG